MFFLSLFLSSLQTNVQNDYFYLDFINGVEYRGTKYIIEDTHEEDIIFLYDVGNDSIWYNGSLIDKHDDIVSIFFESNVECHKIEILQKKNIPNFQNTNSFIYNVSSCDKIRNILGINKRTISFGSSNHIHKFFTDFKPSKKGKHEFFLQRTENLDFFNDEYLFELPDNYTFTLITCIVGDFLTKPFKYGNVLYDGVKKINKKSYGLYRRYII